MGWTAKTIVGLVFALICSLSFRENGGNSAQGENSF